MASYVHCSHYMRERFKKIRNFFFVFLLSTIFFQSVSAQKIYGISNRVLVTFDANEPNIILSTVELGSLPVDKRLAGFDIRPATGEFYTIGYNMATGAARLFTLNGDTGEFTAVGTEDFMINPGIRELALDFNPLVDRVRVLGSDGSNLRLHPDTGVLLAVDGMLSYNSGDVNEGKEPFIVAGAYTNSFDGTTSTTLFNYDADLNIIVSQIPPNDGILNTIGQTGIKVDIDRPIVDLDIYYDFKEQSNTCYAVVALTGVSCNLLYKIDLGTGEAAIVGAIGGTEDIMKIAVELDQPGMSFRSNLSGRNEMFPIATLASGEVWGWLQGNMLTVEGSFKNLSSPVNIDIAGGAHIHRGLAGQNGPVEFVLTLSEGDDAFSGVFRAEDNRFELSEELVEALMNRELYVNIHSESFHSGELRGQLVHADAMIFGANLFGSNEVPTIVSEGFGAVIAELIGDTLTVSGSFDNLEGDFAEQIAGGAHIHFGITGENGGIALHLHADVANDLKSGRFELEKNKFAVSEQIREALLSSGLYVNIHTSLHNSGELRGQLVPDNQMTQRAALSGYNEYPYVLSLGDGQILAELNGDQLRVSGTFSGLKSPVNTAIAGGAHLHIGVAGINGGILVGLNPELTPDGLGGQFFVSDNTFTLEEEQIALFLERGVYINIHTMEDHAGELRGQFLNESQYFMNSYLTGSQEVPQVVSSGHGAVLFEISGNHIIATGSFSDLDGQFDANIAGGAHVHMGFPGQNGGILTHLHPDTDSDLRSGVFRPGENRKMIDADQKAAFKNREAYVNIHTTLHAPGEIRGNILGEAAIYAYALLGGVSEVPPILSDGMGAVSFEINRSGLIASGSFTLDSGFDENIAGGAHIHFGMAGQNGGIALHLHATTAMDLQSGVFLPMENRKEIDAAFLESFMRRNLYVNIHTENVPSGEIRGQMLPLADSYFHSNLSGLHEVPTVMSNGNGSVKAELTSDNLVLSGRFSNLDGEFDENIAGGAHVHIGVNGQNGDIAFHLHTDLEMGRRSGFFAADRNVFTLSESDLEDLKKSGLYVNIHTTTVPSGEIRGQLLKEINFAPESTMMEQPENGTVLDVRKLGMEDVILTWMPSEDRNGDLVTYIWQSSFRPDFDLLLTMVDAGVDPGFNISASDFIGLIDTTTFDVGDTLMLFHKVTSKDGADISDGEVAVLMLTKDMSTNITDFNPSGFSFDLYPTLINNDHVFAKISSNILLEGEIIVVNQSGKVISTIAAYLQEGENEIRIPTDSLPPGIYFSFFSSDNVISGVKKFVKQ